MDLDFDINGNLPAGIHWFTWKQFQERFGYSKHRKELCAGLWKGMQSLKAAGCKTVYVDGSFVTSKEVPGDFDACWDTTNIDWDLLNQIDPTLLSFDNMRAAQKAKYKGEFFPATTIADDSGGVFLDFFQSDRDGNPKGVVAINLRDLSE